MKIRGVGLTSAHLYAALRHLNEKYDGNIRFHRCEWSKRGGKGDEYNVVLHTSSSKGKGGSLSFSGRRTPIACWHVWGDFLKLLPENAETYSITGGKSDDGMRYLKAWRSAHDFPVDVEFGSKDIGWKLFSEMCKCPENGMLDYVASV